jgi:hypothetical protein
LAYIWFLNAIGVADFDLDFGGAPSGVRDLTAYEDETITNNYHINSRHNINSFHGALR